MFQLQLTPIIPVTEIVDLHKKYGKRPDYDIYIGRIVEGTEFTKDSIWANPFHGVNALKFYYSYILHKIITYPKKYDLQSLVNKKLGCWCLNTKKVYPLQCHGQILLFLIETRILQRNYYETLHF